MLKQRERGLYSATVAIPSHLLNIGSYRVIAGIVKNNPVCEYERLEALVFNILEIGNLDSVVHDNSNRRGALQPRLEWKTERV
jgi:hypothetical protein